MSNKVVRNIKNVTLLLLVVKAVGFIKQAVIASTFGANADTDTFLLVSELVENLGEVLFSSIAITFLTLYINTLEKNGEIERNKLVSTTLSFGSPIVISLVIIVFVFAEPIAKLMAPGYDVVQIVIVTKYLKIIAISLLMMFITAVFRAILDAEKVFLPAKFEGIIKSILMIGACIFLGKQVGVEVLVYSIVAYYVIASMYLYFNVRKNTNLRITLDFRWNKGVKFLIIYSVPLFISNGSVYLQNIIDKAIGSKLGEGSISYISYSGYLVNTLHSLVIGSVCTVLFSYFSTYVAEKNIVKLKSELINAVRSITIVATYIVLMVLIEADDIITFVYGRGAFSYNDIVITSQVMSFYVIGLMFIGLRDILIRVHYAYQDTWAPMVNGLIGTASNIALSLILSKYIGVYGIIIGTVGSYLVVMILSLISVRKYVTFFKESKLIMLVVQLTIISMIIILEASWIGNILSCCNVLIRMIINCSLSTVVFIAILYLIKNKEVQTLYEVIAQKWRKK